jgi:hypothetical protein
VLLTQEIVFIPGLLGGENILKNHGEIFTLTGQKAIYLKNLIEKNNITNIEVYTGPIEEEVINSIEDVEYLDLYSLGSNTFANWQTSEYMTDIQVKINDNEWISLNTFDIGIGESEI